MNRLAVFGGTFNPIHKGHLRLAQEAARQLELDRVLLIPTWSPPHKEAADLAPANHRLAMCRLAAREMPLLEVSDLELRRGGSSYTIDTLEQLCRIYSGWELTLLVGGDMLLSFREWKRWREILELTALCAAPRCPEERPALAEYAEGLVREGWRCRVLELVPLELSSTEIRRALARGEDASALLGEPVAAYIRKHQLYRKKGGKAP